MKKILFSALFLCFLPGFLFAQKDAQTNQINVFLTCVSCDINYIKQEMTQVNYVQRLEYADVWIRTNRWETGSGGYRHIFFFVGQNWFKDYDQELFLIENPDMSFEEFRIGFLNILKAGLTPYILHNSSVDGVNIEFSDSLTQTPWQNTKWQNWTLRTGGRLAMTARSSGSRTYELDPFFVLGRETEKMQFRTSYDLELAFSKSNSGDKNHTYSHEIRSFYATSFAPQFSLGFDSGILMYNQQSQKTRDYFFSPLIEYSIWPYEEFYKRRFVIQYSINSNNSKFIQSQALTTQVFLFKKWGFVSGSYTFRHSFLSNKTRDNISMSFAGSVWFRLSQGFYVSANALLSGSSTFTDDLETASSTLTRFSINFNYALGSIYNNVVNPMLGF